MWKGRTGTAARLAALLREGLDAGPEPETAALAEEIREGQTALA